MKYLSISIFMLFVSGVFSVYSQDVITLRNGDQITAKVSEISPTEIKYRKFDNLNGPVVSISRASVFSIDYENGTREVMNAAGSTDKTPATPSEAPSEAPSAKRSPVAQSTGITFGVRAGVNFSRFRGADTEEFSSDFGSSGTGFKTSFKPGIQLGAIVEYPVINGKLFIQAGVLFSQTGSTHKTSESIGAGGITMGTDVSVKMTLNYLQIPCNIVYKHQLGKTDLLLQAGPYLGYGINGKMKSEVTVSVAGISESENESEKIDFKELNSIDFGLGFGAGVQFGNIQAVLGYNLGLTNISPYATVKNNSITFTLAYLFGK